MTSNKHSSKNLYPTHHYIWAAVTRQLAKLYRGTGRQGFETTASAGNAAQTNKEDNRLDWYQATHGTD